jgi:hypothetical protein
VLRPHTNSGHAVDKMTCDGESKMKGMQKNKKKKNFYKVKLYIIHIIHMSHHLAQTPTYPMFGVARRNPLRCKGRIFD